MSGNYIVTYKDSATNEQINEHIAQLQDQGGHVTNRFGSLLKGYSASIPQSFLQQLQNFQADGDGIIEAIEPDQTVTIQ